MWLPFCERVIDHGTLLAVMSIASMLLVLPSFAISSLVGVGVFAVIRRQHRIRTTAFIRQAFVAPPKEESHGVSDVPTIKAAEHQLGLVCRRMRAYLQDPYDFARSRIKDDADFERSLDLAVALSIRISDLGGEAMAGGKEAREHVRQQILEGLVNRMNLREPRAAMQDPLHRFRGVLRA